MALLEYIKTELGELKKAPVSCAFLIIVSILSGIEIGSWHFSERLEAKDGEIHRYRVALGIDKASDGSLVELNNQELLAKATATVAKLRDLDDQIRERFKAMDSQKLSPHDLSEAQKAATLEFSQEFERNLSADADNVRLELRRRLTPEAIAHVIRVPAFQTGGGVSVPITDLMKGTGFEVGFIKGLADEIEQMAKLLPPDSQKP